MLRSDVRRRFQTLLCASASVCALASARSATVGEIEWEHFLELPAEQRGVGNAWHRWTAALDATPALTLEEAESLVAGDAREVERACASRAELLEAFRMNSGERVQMPRLAGATAGLPVHVSRIAEVGRLWVARARLRMAQGREAEAVDEVVMLLRMGFAVVRDPGSMVGYVRGLALVRSGLEEARRMAERVELSSESARRLLEAVADRDESLRTGCTHALRAEYQLYFRYVLDCFTESGDADAAIDVLAALGASETRGRRVFGEIEGTVVDKAATRALYGVPLARALAHLETHWQWRGGLLDGAFAEPSARWRAELAHLWRHLHEDDRAPVSDAQRAAIIDEFERVENPIGKVWVMMATGTRDVFLQSAIASSADQRVTGGLFALRLAIAEGRALPEQLVEVSNLEDPFSGSPLRYDRARAAVWSVGANGIDDGGVSDTGEDGRPLDIVRALSPRVLVAR